MDDACPYQPFIAEFYTVLHDQEQGLCALSGSLELTAELHSSDFYALVLNIDLDESNLSDAILRRFSLADDEWHPRGVVVECLPMLQIELLGNGFGFQHAVPQPRRRGEVVVK